ncbi:hypothetical protein [Myroides indicus]|uniref:Uncharacterized protein n=1 Tax=Myroides indicus TaxID=1323422 RepID=A0A4R7F4C8_9FLAO|nr:hypothetical protein [Myroides indicus]TDS62081.1 hypothetical protein C8P70_10747 [Myroides indicus]
MKKYIFLFAIISLVIGCSQDNQLSESYSDTANLQNTILNSVTLNNICEQIILEYENQIPIGTVTLQHKINLLNSIALQNNTFLMLNLSNYTKITAEEAGIFLTNAEWEYNQLDISEKMNSYLNIILSKDYSFLMLRSDIDHDTFLTDLEKNTLFFILDRVRVELGYHDPTWDKRNIVGIVKGYQNSPAQAVFNAALIKICQE